MRILHTSDWHIGRTFHGNVVLDALRGVLDALVARVAELRVDVVIVAGDVFDSAAPAAPCYPLLTDVLAGIRAAGAEVVLTSGNHDSAARLGFQAPFLGAAGVHVLTDPHAVGVPVTLEDASGPVHVYGVPYLEPALVRDVWPGVAPRTQEEALGHALGLIAADHAARGGRSVVVSHCFAGDVEPTTGVERGTLDVVPVSAFAGHDYVALGHIHGRARLAEGVRYSGAPLHHGFGEAAKPRGAWLVDLAADGLAGVDWVDLPVPRRLATIRGTLDALLTDDALAPHEDDWVCAVLTDPAPPVEPMRRLRARFPHCAAIRVEPEGGSADDGATFRERVSRARSDHDLVSDFLAHVREGEAASADERALLADVVSEWNAGRLA